MCSECGGTGMFDVLSSIPCSCMKRKNIPLLIVKMCKFERKAVRDQRYDDALMFSNIKMKIRMNF